MDVEVRGVFFFAAPSLLSMLRSQCAEKSGDRQPLSQSAASMAAIVGTVSSVPAGQLANHRPRESNTLIFSAALGQPVLVFRLADRGRAEP